MSFRLRGYLENAMVNYQAACQTPDSPEIAAARKRIRKKIRELIRRMRRQGCLSYRFDFDTILEFYPVRTRLYRFVREKTEGFRRKENA